MKKANPYDPDYVMKRDSCTREEAETTISNLKNLKQHQRNFIKNTV